MSLILQYPCFDFSLCRLFDALGFFQRIYSGEILEPNTRTWKLYFNPVTHSIIPTQSNETSINILDKYYPTTEDIFPKSTYPTLPRLPKLPQKADFSTIAGD